MTKKKTTTKLVLLIISVLLVIAGIILFLPALIDAAGYLLRLFAPFIASYLLSLLVNPMADGLQRRFRMPRGLSAVLVIILTVGVIGGIISGIIWKIVDEIKAIYNDFPMIYENIRLTWQSISDSVARFTDALPDGLSGAANNLTGQVSEWLARFAENAAIVESAGNAAKKVPSVFISTIVFILSLYFMVSDSKTVALAVKRPFSPTFINRVTELRREIKRYVGGYVKAQLSIMCIAFVILLVGLSVLGVNYALIIALLTAVVDALPFFGSGTVLLPWAVVSFVTDKISTGIGLVIIYLSVIFMRQFIEPKIVSKNIGMHPIITLISMYVGYRIFSIGGMILGPLAVMLVKSFYKVGLFDDLIKILKNTLAKIQREFQTLKNILENEGEE